MPAGFRSVSEIAEHALANLKFKMQSASCVQGSTPTAIFRLRKGMAQHSDGIRFHNVDIIYLIFDV